MENGFSLKNISTRALVDELVNRAGVDQYRSMPFGDINIQRKYTNRGDITCPCVLLIHDGAFDDEHVQMATFRRFCFKGTGEQLNQFSELMKTRGKELTRHDLYLIVTCLSVNEGFTERDFL